MKKITFFDYKIQGKRVRGFISEKGTIYAYHIWNSTISGRTYYKMNDRHKIEALNTFEGVKMALRKAYDEFEKEKALI